MVYKIFSEGAPIIIADMANYTHWKSMAKPVDETEYETNFKLICDKLNGFGLISFMPGKSAIFMETMGGGPLYCYLDEKSKEITIFKSLSQMSYEEGLKIFQNETEITESLEVFFSGNFIVADSACDLMNFRNIDGENQKEKIDYINKQIALKNSFELIAEGDANASGMVFLISANKYKCGGKYIEINQNQSVFGLLFTPV